MLGGGWVVNRPCAVQFNQVVGYEAVTQYVVGAGDALQHDNYVRWDG